MGQTVLKRFVNPWLYPDFIFSQTDLAKQFEEAMGAICQDSTMVTKFC